jgi:Putative zinc-finger
MRPLACDRSRAWISLRLDGELSKFEHVLLGAHMAMCRDCRRFADDVEWQTQAIRSAGLEPLGYPIAIPSRRGWRWPAVGVSTAAVAASLAALAIGLRGPTQPQHPAPTQRVAQSGPTLGPRNNAAQNMGGNVPTLAEDPGALGPGHG